MREKLKSLVLRFLARIVARGEKGEVRAMERLLQLEGNLRFLSLFGLTVGLPSVLLAYIGIASIATEEQAVTGEVERQAVEIADAYWTEVDQDFAPFEQQLVDRLSAGRSPLASSRELHRDLLIALRFDDQADMVAPFSRRRGTSAPLELRFDAVYADAFDAEQAGRDPLVVSRMYADAAKVAASRASEGRALFDQARMLELAGRKREAISAFELVATEYGKQRGPWGFRLLDLARLERGKALIGVDPSAGREALQDLVEDLLAETWTVGQGGEAAVARRALSLVEPATREEWVARARVRLAERTSALYWTGELAEELDRLLATQLAFRVEDGRVRWTEGEKALWATTWWGEDFYVFAFDLESVLSRLKADARASVVHGSEIEAYMVGPDEDVPQAIVRRRLAPYLNDWALVAAPADPEALAAELARKRAQRIGLVVLSVSLIAFGVAMSLVLLGREAEVARMKGDFAASVSHELRSPITQIRLKGESLMLGLFEEDELDGAYEAIVRESERLSRLVDNVLDFAAIERGKKSYTLRLGDLSTSIERGVATISSSQELRGKLLDVDLPPDLPAIHHDADAVCQCVINLVSNAAKYSGEHGEIKIRGRRVTDAVEITISDNGIGIAPHDLRKIFEPFFRSADSLARRRKGTGIGLAITAYIMEAHGGRVGVASQPGKGSTFTLRFPLTPPDSSQEPVFGRGQGPAATGA